MNRTRPRLIAVVPGLVIGASTAAVVLYRSAAWMQGRGRR